jgi:hypothetical protein
MEFDITPQIYMLESIKCEFDFQQQSSALVVVKCVESGRACVFVGIPRSSSLFRVSSILNGDDRYVFEVAYMQFVWLGLLDDLAALLECARDIPCGSNLLETSVGVTTIARSYRLDQCGQRLV